MAKRKREKPKGKIISEGEKQNANEKIIQERQKPKDQKRF